MSRAFVNEDDQREAPFVPPRADLPEGVPNYVTPAGIEILLNERKMLLAELKKFTVGDGNDKANDISIVNTRLQMLEKRISSAQVIDRESGSDHEIRFGSTVTLQIGDDKKIQKFQIVGVDEADIKQGKIAFISPIARMLMHKKTNETVTLKLGNEEKRFKVISIE